jgi:hypothetical protein
LCLLLFLCVERSPTLTHNSNPDNVAASPEMVRRKKATVTR